ncbi:MAG: Na+/H+ antiporter subunit E [Butyrivibrio sp.]|nr:Na+/H+ antiporter subunit E [Butyrivibrio sp.]
MGIIFFLFWIILNGKVTFEIAVFGIFISVCVYIFSWKYLDYNPKAELKLIKKIPLIFVYLAVLIKEIIVSTIVMIGYIFNHRDIPEPVLVKFVSPLKSEFARYVLAASITLTPGTITVRLRNGEFQVHCYDKEMARELDSSVFVHLLQKMEGDGR